MKRGPRACVALRFSGKSSVCFDREEKDIGQIVLLGWRFHRNGGVSGLRGGVRS